LLKRQTLSAEEIDKLMPPPSKAARAVAAVRAPLIPFWV
jgi:hypothetical protein